MFRICLLLSLFLFTYSLSIISVDEKSCKVTTNEGKLDLSPLAHSDGTSAAYMAVLEIKEKPPAPPLKLTVFWNPCTDYTLAQATGACTGVEICLDVSNIWTSLGSKKDSKFVVDGDNLQIDYSGGAGLSAVTIDLVCGTAADKFEISTFTGSQVGLRLTSQRVCFSSIGGGGIEGISVGTILCIILIVVVVVYFIAGILILKFVKKAEGTEVVPNKSFWLALPVYVKDGVKFVVKGFKVESSYDEL